MDVNNNNLFSNNKIEIWKDQPNQKQLIKYIYIYNYFIVNIFSNDNVGILSHIRMKQGKLCSKCSYIIHLNMILTGKGNKYKKNF